MQTSALTVFCFRAQSMDWFKSEKVSIIPLFPPAIELGATYRRNLAFPIVQKYERIQGKQYSDQNMAGYNESETKRVKFSRSLNKYEVYLLRFLKHLGSFSSNVGTDWLPCGK